MAKTPEAKVKEKVVAKLKELKAYYFFPATGGYGKSGVPDIVSKSTIIFDIIYSPVRTSLYLLLLSSDCTLGTTIPFLY